MKKLVLLYSMCSLLATAGLSAEVQNTNPRSSVDPYSVDPYCLDECQRQFNNARSLPSIASHCSMANLNTCTQNYYNIIWEKYRECIKSCQHK
jgi:hypothetical protein